MVDNVGAYIGTWFVGMTGTTGFLRKGYQLVIGTGEQGATKPFLTAGYKTAVGFAVLDPDGTPILSTGDGENDPLLFLFVDGGLRYAGYYQGQPLRIYISMAEALTPTVGTTYPAIYGTTTSGDPDQVGVWGAEGNPPPSPEP